MASKNSGSPGKQIGLHFEQNGKTLGVSALSKKIFASLGLPVELDSKAWRKKYQSYFASAIAKELDDPAAVSSALERFTELCVLSAPPESGSQGAVPHGSAQKGSVPLNQVLSDGWLNPERVVLVSVSGPNRHGVSGSAAGQRYPLSRPDGQTWFEAATSLVSSRLAEPGLLASAKILDDGIDSGDLPLLIAFAGGAELAPTLDWLRFGGRVLVLARPRAELWAALIEAARTSSGELLVPVARSAVDSAAAGHPAPGLEMLSSDATLASLAGIDLIENPGLAASSVSAGLAFGGINAGAAEVVTGRGSQQIIFGNYGYAPGFGHVLLQAVAEGLTKLLVSKLTPARVSLSWLATPSDSLAVPLGHEQERILRFRTRSLWRKLQDLPWQLLGALRPPPLVELPSKTTAGLAILDASVNLQGPSYSFAKRTQRWRASLHIRAGGRVSYQVTPPARTDSVLSLKILKATYRGGPRFGSVPFDVAEARLWPAALLAADVLGGRPQINPSYYLDSAIHGGLWLTPYKTSTIWLPATISGLFKREPRIKN